jgi:hypothetical protein
MILEHDRSDTDHAKHAPHASRLRRGGFFFARRRSRGVVWA